MIFSFALTAKLSNEQGKPDPLLAGIKTVTRRDWSEKHAHRVLDRYDKGYRVHQAYSNAPYAKGVKIADIDLIARPYQERLGDMPDTDLLAEGGLWKSKQQFIDLLGGNSDKIIWVVRFQLIAIAREVA